MDFSTVVTLPLKVHLLLYPLRLIDCLDSLLPRHG